MYFKKIRLFSAVSLIFLALALTGCTFNVTNNFTRVREDEKHFTLELFNDCKSDIYGYRVDYFLDGKAIGGIVGSHADESRLSGTDAFQMLLGENHFPKDSDISLLQIQIFVLDRDLKESEPTDLISISAEYGESYDIRVEGSFEKGFSAVME